MKIYSIYDKASEAFSPPIFLPADGIALRQVQDSVADPQSPMHKHPEDFELYRLGEFDQEKGKLKTYQPQKLIDAVKFREEE
jgi:hypothetical protein